MHLSVDDLPILFICEIKESNYGVDCFQMKVGILLVAVGGRDMAVI